jgi:hypothetical protein
VTGVQTCALPISPYRYLWNIKAIKDDKIIGGYFIDLEVLQKNANEGSITLFDCEPFEGKPNHALLIDIDGTPVYAEKEVISKRIKELNEEYVLKALNCLIKNDFDNADEYACIAGNALDSDLRSLAILIIADNCRKRYKEVSFLLSLYKYEKGMDIEKHIQNNTELFGHITAYSKLLTNHEESSNGC